MSDTAQGTLVIGTRRYSSWSLRGWLAVRLAGLDVAERVIPLGEAGTPEIGTATPAGLVPALEHAGHVVWESLAICEYCAELAPALWPVEAGARAHARSMAAEMHAGFRALRVAMPMVLGRDEYRALGPRLERDPAVAADIARIEALWRGARHRFGGDGPFLFGADLGAADAMFAPVVARFLAYRPTLADDTLAYCAAIRLHSLMAEWYEAAAAEPVAWRLHKYESLMPAVG